MTDYKVEHGEDFTVDYCKDVERNYWRNLTFVQPMYGADMSGNTKLLLLAVEHMRSKLFATGSWPMDTAKDQEVYRE